MTQNRNFTADSLSVVELFRGCSYEVPAFQRDYSWTEDECQALWNDINSIIVDSGVYRAQQYPSHFLGPMVVIRADESMETGSSKFLTKFLVIDGQQRLTTLQMILALISDRWKVLGEQRNTSAGMKPYYEMSESLINSGAPTYDLSFLPNFYIRENFKTYIQNMTTREKYDLKGMVDIRNKIKDMSHHEELFQAYFFFKKRISIMNRENLEKFENVLHGSMFILRIDAGSIGNAFVLFDTLNNRGLDLTQGDLLKNHIFKMIDPTATFVLTPEVTMNLAKWDGIVDTVNYKRLDNFLRYFLILQKKTKVQREMIMGEIEKIYDSKEKVKTLLKDLENSARLFSLIERDTLFEGTNGDALNLLFSDTNDLGQSTQAIFLMAALKRFNNYNAKDDFQALSIIVRSAEILSFYWTICGENAQDLENIWIDGVKILDKKLLTNEELVSMIRKEFGKNLPSKLDLKRAFEGKVIRSSKFARYILKKFEHASMGSTTWVLAGSSTLDVEHIAPKTPDQGNYWKQAMEGSLPYSSIINSIGNQILLSKGPNRSAKNKPLNEKNKFYAAREGKDLPLISNFILNKKSWKQSDIVSRSKVLASTAVEVWDWDTAMQEIRIKKISKKKRKKSPSRKTNKKS